MGSVVGTLLYYYCRSGCQASVVASFLAFYPPIPTYSVEGESDTCKFVLTEKLNKTAEDLFSQSTFTVHIIETATKTRIPVLYFKHPEAKYTIIFSHGNAVDIGGMIHFFLLLYYRLKVSIAAYDYTGYGPLSTESPTVRPTERQTYRDIEAVFDWLVDSGRVAQPERELLLYGQSVGSGPSCYLAAQAEQPAPRWRLGSARRRRAVAGLVLHSGILSGLRVLTARCLKTSLTSSSSSS